jgi:hypothetical protein
MVDPFYETNVFNKMDKFLVEIDVKEGMVESVDIEMDHRTHKNILDYCNVPFTCVRCHMHGHISKDYPKSFMKKVWRRNIENEKIHLVNEEVT